MNRGYICYVSRHSAASADDVAKAAGDGWFSSFKETKLITAVKERDKVSLLLIN